MYISNYTCVVLYIYIYICTLHRVRERRFRASGIGAWNLGLRRMRVRSD